MGKQKFTDIFYFFRDLYTVVYISFFAILFFIPVQNLLGNITTYLYLAIAGAGAALLVVSVFVSPKSFFSPQNILLTAFAIAALLSTAVNYRYQPISNIKEICWMCIMFFLLHTVDASRPKEKLLYLFRLVTDIFVFLWFVGVFVSFCQFVSGYGEWISTPYNENELHRVGFIEGRLFGVFGDPNYAAIGSFFAIVLSMFHIIGKNMGKGARAFLIISMVFEYFYIILSGSRAAMISVAVAVFFVVFFLVLKAAFTQKIHPALRCICAVLSAGVSAVLIVIISDLIKEGLAYLPELYSSVGNAFGINVKQNTVVDIRRPDIDDGNDYSNNRFKIWADSIAVWKTTPIVGATPRGYLDYTFEHLGNIYIVQKGYVIHNAYISVILFTGIIGSLIVVAWIARTAYMILKFLFIRKISDCPSYKRVLFLSAAIVAEAVSSMALSQMFFSHMVTDAIFWLIVGYTFYYIDLENNKAKEPEKIAGKAE